MRPNPIPGNFRWFHHCLFHDSKAYLNLTMSSYQNIFLTRVKLSNQPTWRLEEGAPILGLSLIKALFVAPSPPPREVRSTGWTLNRFERFVFRGSWLCGTARARASPCRAGPKEIGNRSGPWGEVGSPGQKWVSILGGNRLVKNLVLLVFFVLFALASRFFNSL